MQLSSYTYLSTIFFISLLTFSVNAVNPLNWDASKITYPKATRANTTFTYESLLANGKIVNVTVGDPYNWLEQDVDKSNATKAFVKAEMALTQSYIDKNKDFDAIRTSIASFDNHLSLLSLVPFGSKNDKKYLFSLRSLNESRPTWYIATEDEMQQGFKDQFSPFPGKRWFDENLLSESGTDAVGYFFPSPDGKLMAYTVVSGGGDVSSIYVRKTSSPLLTKPSTPVAGGSGRLSDVIPQYANGGLYWISDSSGFVYEQELRKGGGWDSQILFHKVGKSNQDDILMVRIPKDNEESYFIFMTADRSWLIVCKGKGVDDHNAVYVASLTNQPISNKMKWLSLVPDLSATYYPFGSIGSTFYFKTNADGAINGKVVAIQVNPSKAKTVDYLSDLTDRLPTKTIIPERPDAQLENIDLELAGYTYPTFDLDKVLIYYTKNASQEIFVYDLKTGKLISEVLAQGHGTVDLICTDWVSNEIYLFTESMNKPDTLHRLSIGSSGQLETELIFDAEVAGVDLDSVVSEHRFSISKDGTKVPFTMFYKKGSKFDGTKPAILVAYGSYGIITLPTYAPRFLDWIFHYDGVIIISNPRGGGENGAQWHVDGMLEKRQNTVDDVISVAEYLVENKIVGFGKIVVNGGSAGGTLCMVVTNQAPEGLLGGAICDRGIYDMLRFTVMQISGPANTPEFGDPNNASDFTWLEKFSPLHNVNASKVYPAVLLFGTANDDRVSPTNNYKMIAELQYDLSKNKFPLLMYIQSGQGHSNQFFSRKTYLDGATVRTAIMAEALGLTRT